MNGFKKSPAETACAAAHRAGWARYFGSNAGMDITTFDDLLLAARQQPDPQRLLLVFAGALAGQAPLPPSESQVEAALEQMVEAVRVGDLVPYLAFDREGHAVTLV